MKFLQLILLAAILGISSTTVSCTTTPSGGNNDERAHGISADDPAMSRRSIYDLQDRTFRGLLH